MANQTNICLFGVSECGKTSLTNVITGGSLGEDYLPTASKAATDFKKVIDGVEFSGTIFEEPGKSFEGIKATVATYATSGYIHIFMASSGKTEDWNFCNRYATMKDYTDCFNDNYLFVVIITKKDENEECHGAVPENFAKERNGLCFKLDLHNTDEVNNAFEEILRTYGQRKGFFKGGKKGGSKKADKKGGDDKSGKKKGCVLL